MKTKVKIPYHPKVDPNKDSVIIKQAYIKQLESIQKLVSPQQKLNVAIEKVLLDYKPSVGFINVAEKLSKTLASASKSIATQLGEKAAQVREKDIIRSKDANSKLQIAIKKALSVYEPTSEFINVVNNLKLNIEKQPEWSTTIEKLKKSTKPSIEYLSAIENLKLSNEVISKSLERIAKLKETNKLSKDLKDAIKKLTVASEPAPQLLKSIERLKKSYKPSKKFESAISELIKSLKPSSELTKNIEVANLIAKIGDHGKKK